MNDELATPDREDFTELLSIIERARENAYRAVNRELITMYWDVGQHVSKRVHNGGWGKSVVKEFSAFVQRKYAGIQGFSPQNIWRMKQFYETYSSNEKLSPLVREISWSNNLLVMTGAKTAEEQEFYLRLSAQFNYSKRELERQMDSMLYERTVISDEKNKLILTRCPVSGIPVELVQPFGRRSGGRDLRQPNQ